MIFSFGLRQAAPTVATAVDTPRSCKNPRRELPSRSAAPPGNSLAAPGVTARDRSSMDRQSLRVAGGPPAGAPPEPTTGSERRTRSLARASWLSSQLIAWASSVTRGAARSRVDVVLRRQQPAGIDRVSLGLPIHVGDLGDRTEVRLRMSVTVEAEPHGHRGVLLDRRHLVDASVAADAADALVHVDGVVEVDELGNLVDAPPFERFVLDEALAHRLEEGALVPDLRVAVETELRRRDAGGRRLVDRVVAIAAVDPFVTRVVAVIELQRLLDGILHPARVGRAGVKHQSSRYPHCTRRHHEQRDLRERVVLRSKERTHPRSASIYAELGGRVKRSIR